MSEQQKTADDNLMRRTLLSPLTGIAIPIEHAPDPVFAQKMVGDGISVDPLEGMLVAPCDGEVVQLHDSHHAITIHTEDDIDILIHIGIDTVGMKGKGFSPQVNVGDHVQVGQVLIEFDLMAVAIGAPYSMTQLVITNMDKVANLEVAPQGQIEKGDFLLSYSVVEQAAESSDSAAEQGDFVLSDPIYLCNTVGLHARPAAQLTQLLAECTSDVELRLGDKSANARSITALLKLNTKYGDPVVLAARGADAEAVLEKVVPAIHAGLGDEGVTPLSGPVQAETAVQSEECEAPAVAVNSTEPPTGDLKGVSASDGIAIGTCVAWANEELELKVVGAGHEQEVKRLQDAIGQAKASLNSLIAAMKQTDPQRAKIFNAHLTLLDDPELSEQADRGMSKQNYSAEYAWRSAYSTMADELESLSSEVLAERANDVRDVGERVLHKLLGIDDSARELPDNAIIIADNLTPSVTATLDPKKVLGFCTVEGGASSHVAILARSMGMPAVVGLDKSILNIADGTALVVDGSKGVLSIAPDAKAIAELKERQRILAEKAAVDLANCQQPATTLSGRHIEVVANVGKLEETTNILALGGEGIGLLRSEFLFQSRSSAPTEDEQYDVYVAMINAVGKESKVIIRTLDVGGDKPLQYLPIPEEENPFLGIRGIRVSLREQTLFRAQLRALIRASVHGHLHIMFPMISNLSEWHEAKAIYEEERAALGIAPQPVGMMIEVPSAALIADEFAKEVDFFSVGTNDLCQYTLAVDRGHPEIAALADGLHPSVLRLIEMTVTAAHKEGKWVGVCGGLGADPEAVPQLLKAGVDELSIPVPSIPAVKALIRTLDL